MMQPEQLKDFIFNTLEEMQAQDITVFNVRDTSDITDYMMIASGRSDRHVKAIADDVIEKLLGKAIKPIGKVGFDSAQWILLDYADVIVHIMRVQTREFYDLESLWGEEASKLVKAYRKNMEL